MFKELKKVLDKVNLHIEISSNGANMGVTIHPRKKDNDDAITTIPLRISGTADEIDENLPSVIEKHLSKVIAFTDNVKEFEEALEKKKEEGKTSLANKTKSTDKKKEEPDTTIYDAKKASKSQKDAYAAIQKLITSANGKEDDMINYSEKMAVDKANEMGDYKDNMLEVIKAAFIGIRGKAEETKAETASSEDGPLFNEKETPAETKVKTTRKKKETPPTLPAEKETEEEEEADAAEVDDSTTSDEPYNELDQVF